MFLLNYRFFWSIFFLGNMLSACSFHEQIHENRLTPMPLQWKQNQKIIKNITQYQIRGVLSWFSGKKKGYAYFNWYQKLPGHYRLLLTNPLGFTIFQINQEDQSTQFICKLRHCPNDSNIEEALFRMTGMSFPLENIHQWIMGLPGNITTFTIDEQYHLRQLNFSENGKIWRILYLAYHSVPSLPSLPSKIELHQGKQSIILSIYS
ncbi:lipoprotein insertase outer membrane protein LolB [Candidatus Erwinia haradaeae]|nr:lipoprotein insertase outer membrane protein LolB [Candidatus Erwinia haradaeae]